jgi:hypothetical protein
MLFVVDGVDMLYKQINWSYEVLLVAEGNDEKRGKGGRMYYHAAPGTR